MTSRLDEIKNVLAAWDSRKPEGIEQYDMHEWILVSPYYLRDLLAVCEAAIELAKGREVGVFIEYANEEGDAIIERFQQAVAKLTLDDSDH